MPVKNLLNYGTSVLSDALDSLKISGGLLGLKPRSFPCRFAGQAFTVKYELITEKQTSFQQAGNYIDNVPAGNVIVIDNAGRDFCTTWGAILTETAKLKDIAATVVNGAIRDLSLIQSLEYPVFSKHIFMQSGKNRVRKTAHQVPLQIESINIFPGDWICGDEDGCIVIPKASLEEVLKRADAILKTETSILNAVLGGEKLEDARERFNYREPWKVE